MFTDKGTLSITNEISKVHVSKVLLNAYYFIKLSRIVSMQRG